MAENPVLSPISSFVNDTSAAATYNANNALITNSFADCLSLSGTLPNSMLSNLDMNSNQIINLPAPSTINSPVRLGDLTTGTTVSTANFAILGNNNTFTGFNTFNQTILPSVVQTALVQGGVAAASALVLRSTSSGVASGDLITIRASSIFFQSAPTGGATYGEIFPSGGWCISNAPIDPGAGNLQVGGAIAASSFNTTGTINTASTTAISNSPITAFRTSASNVGLFVSNIDPTYSAPQGSLHINTAGAGSHRLFINNNGSTGWTNIV